MARPSPAVSMAFVILVACAETSPAQDAVKGGPGPAQAPRQSVSCVSRAGERVQCAADTSAGVALAKSTGAAPCLLGKTWGYDDTGIWVADGCSAEFIAGQAAAQQTKTKAPEHVPNAGF